MLLSVFYKEAGVVNMNRQLVFNMFAQKVQANRDYYVFGRPSQFGLIEDVLGLFGFAPQIEAHSESMHQKGLVLLQDFILNKATDDQVNVVYDIVQLGKNVPVSSPACDSSGKVFVSMPMNQEKYSCVDIIRDGMRRGIEGSGNIPYFLDQDVHLSDITEKMIVEIRSCKFLVADFTCHITGVYYEAGYAVALGKTVIHTCQSEDVGKMHFDINYIQAITWSNADELANKLAGAIKSKGL